MNIPKSSVLYFILTITAHLIFSQDIAITLSGDSVILNDDGTWIEYEGQNFAITLNGDTVFLDDDGTWKKFNTLNISEYQRIESSIDDGTIYGRQRGGSNGASLQMAGWVWDFKPNPNDKSDESGKIVYMITIDDEGYIQNIKLQSSTVSRSVERVYRQSVERLSFSKTGDYKPRPTSTGTITFLIHAK